MFFFVLLGIKTGWAGLVV